MTYHFFYGGVLSQWYPAGFEYGGVWYNCTEQAMMAAKANLFEDWETWHAIMQTVDPHEQKTLGRCVRRFNAAKWNEQAREIVYWVNYAKFQQNPALREELYKTRQHILVEASPTDRLWGIGLSESDPRRLDPKQWRGANWLGEVLMAVRDGKPAEWAKTGFAYETPPPI